MLKNKKIMKALSNPIFVNVLKVIILKTRLYSF